MFGKKKKARQAVGLATMVKIILMGHFKHLQEFSGISFQHASPDLREAFLEWTIGTIFGCAQAAHIKLEDVDRATLVGELAPHMPEMWMGVAGSLELALDGKLPSTSTRNLAARLAINITKTAPEGQESLINALSASTADLVMHFLDLHSDVSDGDEDEEVEDIEVRPSGDDEENDASSSMTESALVTSEEVDDYGEDVILFIRRGCRDIMTMIIIAEDDLFAEGGFISTEDRQEYGEDFVEIVRVIADKVRLELGGYPVHGYRCRTLTEPEIEEYGEDLIELVTKIAYEEAGCPEKYKSLIQRTF